MSNDSRYTEPFYGTPYSLHEHFLWKTSKNDEKECFRVIQFRSVVFEMDYNNNGLIIRLKRGQCCISLSQLAAEANTTIKKARGAINHYRGFERSGKKALQLPSHVAPILRAQQKAQLGAQQKSVLDILLDGYFINEGTAKGTAKGSVEGTARAQRGHTNKEAKEAKNVSGSKDPSTTMAAKPPAPPDSSITKETAIEALQAKGITNPKDHKQVLKSWGSQKVWLGLQYIFSDEFVIDTTPIQALNWACGIEAWNKPKIRKTSTKEIILQTFEDGKTYKGYTCSINSKGICFFAGAYTQFEGKFEDKPFVANFNSFCERVGLSSPFNKTFNIKEA